MDTVTITKWTSGWRRPSFVLTWVHFNKSSCWASWCCITYSIHICVLFALRKLFHGMHRARAGIAKIAKRNYSPGIFSSGIFAFIYAAFDLHCVKTIIKLKTQSASKVIQTAQPVRKELKIEQEHRGVSHLCAAILVLFKSSKFCQVYSIPTLLT